MNVKFYCSSDKQFNITCISDLIMYKIAYYTRSPCVTCLSRRAQSLGGGRGSSNHILF